MGSISMIRTPALIASSLGKEGPDRDGRPLDADGSEGMRASVKARLSAMLENQTASNRRELAASFASDYARGRFSGGQSAVIEEVLLFLAVDSEPTVRQALSYQLKDCAFLPASLARSLAFDIISVAVPVIESCPAIGDQDLIELAERSDEAKLCAIARRANLSALVASAIAALGEREALEALLSNETADLGNGVLEHVATRLGDWEIRVGANPCKPHPLRAGLQSSAA